MKKLILLLFIISCVTATACKEKKQPDNGSNKTVTFKTVTAKGGLRMRSAPNLSGSITGLLQESTVVKFLKESGDAMTIAGKTGKWTQVEFNGKKGWVFGGFLKEAVDPGMGEVSDQPLDISSIMGKNCGFKLKQDEYADEVTFKLHTNKTFSAECLLHGSGKATVTGTYSQLPDGTAWRYVLKGVANILHVSDKAKRFKKKFSNGSLVIKKENGKLVGTIKDIPNCEAFINRELVY